MRRIGRGRAAAAAAVAGFGLLAGANAAAEAAASSPHIVVRPAQNLESGQLTKVVGKGFVASTPYTLVECRKVTWTAPKGPCGTNNKLIVATSAAGEFTARFTVELCSVPKPPATIETCYVGVLAASGGKQGQLYAPARITVLTR